MLNRKSDSPLKVSKFIKLAYEQAKINLGSTGPNPSVGCVVEKNGSVIASAHTSLNGRPHAEFNALNKRINFRNSNIYISLEPCSHYGKTPPCTKIIIKKKIKKVFFSIFDVDKRSNKKSIHSLRNKNILVKNGINEKYGKNFYESYYLNKKKLLPYLDAKVAISKDYFTKNISSKWITNQQSRTIAHLIRSNYDCIMSTSKSINDDNSELNCRIEGLERKSPSVVIIDRNLKLKKNLKIIKNKQNRKIYILTVKKNKDKELFFKKKGIKIIKLDKMSSYNDYLKILKLINKLGISRILLESGLNIFNFFLKGKMINNLYIFKANKGLGKKGINYSSPNNLKKIQLNNKRVNVYLNGDTLYKIKIK